MSTVPSSVAGAPATGPIEQLLERVSKATGLLIAVGAVIVSAAASYAVQQATNAHVETRLNDQQTQIADMHADIHEIRAGVQTLLERGGSRK